MSHGYDVPVAVVGGGSWGTTLAHLFAINGTEVLLWVRRKELAKQINSKHLNQKYLPDYLIQPNVRATTDLEEVARRSPYIVIAVPSKYLRSTAYDLGEYLRGDQILVTATKGLEDETFFRMSEVLREETCCKKIGALRRGTQRRR